MVLGIRSGPSRGATGTGIARSVSRRPQGGGRGNERYSRDTFPSTCFLRLIHIQMPVGALTSIAHRLTGILLAASIPIGVYLLDLSLRSDQAFAEVAGLFKYWAVKGVVVILIWALAHHMLAGVRHLCRTSTRFAIAPGASQRLVGDPRRRGRGPVCGWGLAVRLRFTGLKAWWVQRVSAVYVLLFVVFVLAAFSLYPRHSYLEWKSCVSSPSMTLAIFAFFTALLSHMWVGLRDVLLDYARLAGLRRVLLGMLGAGLLGIAVWVLWILVQLQA